VSLERRNEEEEEKVKLRSAAHLSNLSFPNSAGRRLDNGNLELSLKYVNDDLMVNAKPSNFSQGAKIAFPGDRHYLNDDEKARVVDVLSPMVRNGDPKKVKTYRDAALEAVGWPNGPGTVGEKLYKLIERRIKDHEGFTPLDALWFGMDFAWDVYKRIDQYSIALPLLNAVHGDPYLFCSLEIDSTQRGVRMRESLCYAGRDTRSGTDHYSILWKAEYRAEGWEITTGPVDSCGQRELPRLGNS
jgi:hypothetical protein